MEEHRRRRQNIEEEEMKISLQVALKNPVRLPVTVVTLGGTAQLDQWAQSKREDLINCADMPNFPARVHATCAGPESEAWEAVSGKARGARADLPAHLTTEILEEAYKELGAGAEKSIDICLQCWRAGKIGSDEFQRVVESFKGGSAVLREHLTPGTPPAGEVATLEQMRELKTILDK